MDRRHFLKSTTAITGATLISVSTASADSTLESPNKAADNAGPTVDQTAVTPPSTAVDIGQPQTTKISPQQKTETVVLSGVVTGNFSSKVGKIRVGPPSNNDRTADISPDGSFATEVPKGEPLNIAYVQTDGSDGRVTLNGNPDVHYVERVDGLDQDRDLGTISIPEGHLLEFRAVDANGDSLSGVRVGVRSLSADGNHWWQVFTLTNTDGDFKSANSLPGIEVTGDIEVVVYADKNNNSLPDSNLTRRFAVTEPQSETVTVDPITVTGRVLDAGGSPAANRDVVVYTTRYDSAKVLTESDGTFSMLLPQIPDDAVEGSYDPVKGTYQVQCYRDELDADLGTVVPEDGYVDMFAGPGLNGRMSEDVGEITLPQGSLTQVHVTDQNGNTVEGAGVRYRHINTKLNTTASWYQATNKDGKTPIGDQTGLVLSGTVRITVVPPDTDQFSDTEVIKEITVGPDGDRTVSVELSPDTGGKENTGETTAAAYASNDGTVQVTGVLKAISDYSDGQIGITVALKVISAYRTGESVK